MYIFLPYFLLGYKFLVSLGPSPNVMPNLVLIMYMYVTLTIKFEGPDLLL